MQYLTIPKFHVALIFAVKRCAKIKTRVKFGDCKVAHKEEEKKRQNVTNLKLNMHIYNNIII